MSVGRTDGLLRAKVEQETSLMESCGMGTLVIFFQSRILEKQHDSPMKEGEGVRGHWWATKPRDHRNSVP